MPFRGARMSDEERVANYRCWDECGIRNFIGQIKVGRRRRPAATVSVERTVCEEFMMILFIVGVKVAGETLDKVALRKIIDYTDRKQDPLRKCVVFGTCTCILLWGRVFGPFRTD